MPVSNQAGFGRRILSRPLLISTQGEFSMNYGLTKTRARLAGGAAILALSASAAMAQQGVEQVVVSSTRLQAAGFDAPTPTTVVSAADLEAQAKPSVFDAARGAACGASELRGVHEHNGVICCWQGGSSLETSSR